jgi:ADP-sugar diphosphatase
MILEKLEDSLKFKSWKNSILQNGNKINSIEELHTIRKKNGEVLFALVKIDAISEEGNKLLPTALIRGNFVTILTVLIDIDTKAKFYLMVKQRRVANGDIFYEHPAGMCDSESDPFKVALKEVEEETGLILKLENLKLLHKEKLYTSGGLLDESGSFFYAEIFMTHEEIKSFMDKKTGATGEHEFITTCILTQEEVFQNLKNTSGLLAMYMYLNKDKSLL